MVWAYVASLFKNKGKSLLMLFGGLFIAAFGTVLMVHTNIGLFPWGTLHEGLARRTHLSFGVWSQIIGALIVIGLVCFKYQPGIGTLIDVFFFGFYIDLLENSHLIPYPSTFTMKLTLSIVGLFILSYGMAFYMKAGLGTGPRDGLMLFLMEKTNKPVVIVKTVLELIVTIVGLLLGGPFGIGTVLLALIGGKVLQMVFEWTAYTPETVKQLSIEEFFKPHRDMNPQHELPDQAA